MFQTIKNVTSFWQKIMVGTFASILQWWPKLKWQQFDQSALTNTIAKTSKTNKTGRSGKWWQLCIHRLLQGDKRICLKYYVLWHWIRDFHCRGTSNWHASFWRACLWRSCKIRVWRVGKCWRWTFRTEVVLSMSACGVRIKRFEMWYWRTLIQILERMVCIANLWVLN